jgi:hypothetical protein
MQRRTRSRIRCFCVKKKRRVIAWMRDCQRQANCPSPREVRDFGSIVYQRRPGHERFSSRDWRRGFRRRHQEELVVDRVAAKEPQRATVTAQAVVHDFDKLREVLPNCLSPNQVLNMEKTGLSVGRLKGKRRKVVWRGLVA